MAGFEMSPEERERDTLVCSFKSCDRRYTFPEPRDQFAECLDVVKALGIGLKKNGRFAAHLETLGRLAELPRPFFFDSIGEAERWRQATIALTEAYQIIQARRIWPKLNVDGLVAKLRKARKGRPFSDDDQESQEARNTLLELAVAAHLYKLGFNVDTTVNDADVIARAASFGSVVVECKRPQSFGSMTENVRRARDQINARGIHGIVGLGIDKIIGIGSRASIAASVAELDAQMDTVTKAEFVRAVAPVVRNLLPTVLAVGVVLSAIIFVDDGTVHRRDVMAFGPTIPEEHPAHAELAARFDGLRRRELPLLSR